MSALQLTTMKSLDAARLSSCCCSVAVAQSNCCLASVDQLNCSGGDRLTKSLDDDRSKKSLDDDPSSCSKGGDLLSYSKGDVQLKTTKVGVRLRKNWVARQWNCSTDDALSTTNLGDGQSNSSWVGDQWSWS